MASLRVRAYNVRFGDAILVTVPDDDGNGKEVDRHILIDVGNVLSGAGGQDDVFAPVIEDIQQVLNGNPVDLYVMTHEHMDHCQGLFWAKEKKGLEIKANHVWMTASAEKGYYDRFPKAKQKKVEFEGVYGLIERHFDVSGERPEGSLLAMFNNNNPRATADCVDHLRTIGTPHYVHRGSDLEGIHPFQEAKLSIWGPEEDTSTYYGTFKPMGLGLGMVAAAAPATAMAGGSAPAPDVLPRPPSGVDAGAFFNLVSRRRGGIFDNLLAIDKAENNTSLVFLLAWRGWKMLFCGDAEERAWKEMNKRGLLEPVHFLKVGHHGSHNGTPDGDLLNAILPAAAPGGRKRKALVSTHEGTYSNVPDADTLDEIKERCDEVVMIGEEKDGLFVDLTFEDS